MIGLQGDQSGLERDLLCAWRRGLLIEVHVDPESAWSDGLQTITPAEYAELTRDIDAIGGAIGRAVNWSEARARSEEGSLPQPIM